MRKLVYVGTDKIGNKIEVTSFTEKKALEAKGFSFTERLDEMRETETEKQREKRLARIAKLEEIRKAKRS